MSKTLPVQRFPGGLTVLMSVYSRDDPQVLRKAVVSVYHNSVQPDDFVLVVDGPVPTKLESMINLLADLYPIRLLRLATNQGLRFALNIALGQIGTTWVARADADDINLPDRFAKQLALIDAWEGELDLVGGAIEEVDVYGRILAKRSLPLNQLEITSFAAQRNPFNHMTVIYRRSLVDECGGYPDLYLKEDYGLWALMLAKGARVRNLQDVLVRATTGDDFYRRRGGWKSAIAEWSLQSLLVKTALKSRSCGLVDFFLRAGIFLAPTAVRRWVYLKRLRELSR